MKKTVADEALENAKNALGLSDNVIKSNEKLIKSGEELIDLFKEAERIHTEQLAVMHDRLNTLLDIVDSLAVSGQKLSESLTEQKYDGATYEKRRQAQLAWNEATIETLRKLSRKTDG